ncbi:SH3 domain-containing protein [Streptomyces sp. NPDC005573]|uniref:SH3 domain-containing protein n=1 Tax=Streptomyces sp. NPDC005573 TaxID=3156890 RepID=UPI0033BBAF87
MSLRSAFPRGLALAAATAALVTAAPAADAVAAAATVATAPVTAPAAMATDGGDGTAQAAADGQATDGQGAGHQGKGDRDPRRYRGVVTAENGLWLRDRPDRGSRRVRFLAKGQTVSIYCKSGSETVDGNSLWYLLTDGTWSWGAARYIDNVGPAPRWC